MPDSGVCGRSRYVEPIADLSQSQSFFIAKTSHRLAASKGRSTCIRRALGAFDVARQGRWMEECEGRLVIPPTIAESPAISIHSERDLAIAGVAKIGYPEEIGGAEPRQMAQPHRLYRNLCNGRCRIVLEISVAEAIARACGDEAPCLQRENKRIGGRRMGSSYVARHGYTDFLRPSAIRDDRQLFPYHIKAFMI